MYGKSIGIILSKQDGDGRDSIFMDYVNRGAELDISVNFFYIDELNVNDMSGSGFVYQNNKKIFKVMPIPAFVYYHGKYTSKKDKQTILELSQHPNVYALNEHIGVKEKHLFDCIASKQELKSMVCDGNGEGSSYFLYAQKDANRQWRIYDFADVFCENQLQSEIHGTTKEIVEHIQFYFPGLDEIGLQFCITNQEYHLQSTFSLLTKIHEIRESHPEVYQNIISWPFERFFNSLNSQMNDDLEEFFFPDSQQLDITKTNALFWTKMKSFESEELIIKIPKRMVDQSRTLPTILQYGVKEENCEFILYDDPILLSYNTFEQPLEIFVSQALVKKLHIPLDIVFQIQFIKEKAVLGPTLGLLLGDKNLRYNLRYMEKYSDRFGAYDRFGGLTIAFSARSVDWENKIAYGLVYDYSKKQWRYGSAPIPAVIYRRNFHQCKEHIQSLRQLTDDNLFNSYHFKKSDLYHLRDQPEISRHLPETFLFKEVDVLIDFIFEKKKVIMKPVGLSRGRGIIILELKDEIITVNDYRDKTVKQYEISYLEELDLLLRDMGIIDEEYLYQTWIPLLKVDDRALDVRVVMQKYNRMKWFCTGIECRVAQVNEPLTNIARGGEAMTLEEVVGKTSFSYVSVHKRILELCNKFCTLMDMHDEHFAEFGIDIALDMDGYPWILEANIYPSFKGFKDLNYETYLKIRYQPLLYAVQIQGFTILDEHEIGRKYSYSKIYHYSP